MGQGYGMATFRVEATDDFPEALAGALKVTGPALIHLKLDSRDVSPFPAVSPKEGDRYKD